MKKIEKTSCTILYMTIIVASLLFCVMYIISCIISGNPKIVEHEYGNTPGNYKMGSCCEGEKGLYFTLADRYIETADVYLAKSVNDVEKVGIQGYDLFYWNGYLYFIENSNDQLNVIRFNENDGTVSVVFSVTELGYDKVDDIELRIDSFVDGNMILKLTEKAGYLSTMDDEYMYIKIDEEGKTELLKDYNSLGIKQYSDSFINLHKSYIEKNHIEQDMFYAWEKTNIMDTTSKRQCYGANIYAFAEGDKEFEREYGECMYAPRELRISPVLNLFYPNFFSCLNIVVDDDVTTFNVTYSELYYAKKEENGDIRILKCDLYGRNETEISVIQAGDEEWAYQMLVGGDVIILKTDNSRDDYEEKTYIISTDGTSVYELKDIIQ